MANQQTKDKKWIDGLFVKKVWQDDKKPDNAIYSIGVKKEDLLHYLNEAETNDDGFINWKMASQVKDNKKMSVWEDDFIPEKRSGGSNYSKSSYKKSPASPPPADDADDLPF